ncbi:anion transporter chloroplastic-like [Nannochloropsis oceanica]
MWATAANMGGRRRSATPRLYALPSGSGSSSKSSSIGPYECEILATTAAATRKRRRGPIPSSASSSTSSKSVRLLPRKPSPLSPSSSASSSRLYASSLQSPDDQQKRGEQGGEGDEGIPPDAWRILALSFLCMIICSLDRVAMSVAILPMSLEFGYSETTKGAISSTFSLGYMASMLPAGRSRGREGERQGQRRGNKRFLRLLSEGEVEVAGALRQVGEKLTSVPWADFVRSPALWAVTFAHMAHNYGLYVLLAWLPTYFSQTYQLDLGQSSTLSVAPWIAAAVVSNLAGWGADYLINSEALPKTTVRKLFQCTALVIPACCMTALAVGTHTPSEAQAIFTLSVAAGSMSSAGFATATQDLADKYIGITYGATSALSVIVGSLGTFGTGVILDNLHEWPYVFGIAAGVYVAGAAAFASLYKAEKIFD